jgi:hypothetical protein
MEFMQEVTVVPVAEDISPLEVLSSKKKKRKKRKNRSRIAHKDTERFRWLGNTARDDEGEPLVLPAWIPPSVSVKNVLMFHFHGLFDNEKHKLFYTQVRSKVDEIAREIDDLATQVGLIRTCANPSSEELRLLEFAHLEFFDLLCKMCSFMRGSTLTTLCYVAKAPQEEFWRFAMTNFARKKEEEEWNAFLLHSTKYHTQRKCCSRKARKGGDDGIVFGGGERKDGLCLLDCQLHHLSSTLDRDASAEWQARVLDNYAMVTRGSVLSRHALMCLDDCRDTISNNDQLPFKLLLLLLLTVLIFGVLLYAQ